MMGMVMHTASREIEVNIEWWIIESYKPRIVLEYLSRGYTH
jgi:hypothetical protein